MFQDPASYVLFCEIVDKLSMVGWHLIAAPDLFITLDDAELIFRREERLMVGRQF